MFGTKNRVPVLAAAHRQDLFRYVRGIINSLEGRLYCINGTADHLHVVSSVHPTCRLADFVKAIKTGSSKWIKHNGYFRDFTNWQDGYAAFTKSAGDLSNLIAYIERQEQHHRKRSFLDEYRELLREAGVEFDENYLL